MNGSSDQLDQVALRTALAAFAKVMHEGRHKPEATRCLEAATQAIKTYLAEVPQLAA